MTAATTCPTCGSQCLAGARFCHCCGAATTAASASAEYKQVTVLFADVVHSRGIAAAVGRARGDCAAYGEYAKRYRQKAAICGYPGHVVMAEAMT
ncbi:hypothetical protein H7H52_12865 [Mycolicibacter hiberniae]|uniref:Uncharacterized protein n=1 Tax=Mycolicibacter hiberniae TaxID=29314 RepID=A0A7I7WXF6_9MYCO|nr:hypothetical protein [Mycolicibacter hiberniae]MCV7086612.1 hypothetical protein [Mycolicibacter hiberniae]ORV66970.1 hypothetical protein AWC09_18780 [Mycolicibacter hiberniae]BBZ22194.1 hypothetical protein MHIB_06120 [Mycolicibacter hiberniae]